jgi:peptidoglycan/LPS O-acetylase OafA/YrhL
MTTANRPAPVDAKLRPLLIGLALVAAALVYLAVRSAGFGTAIFAGVGTFALGLAAADTLTVRPADRSQLLTWGLTLLGIGLIALAVYVAVR